MLEIFNILKPFFSDTYQEFGVREYARKTKISPPTASSTLKKLHKESLLKFREDRNLLLFRANRESALFQDFNRAYQRQYLSRLTEFLSSEFNYAAIILFGSLAKCEQTINADIDLYIHANPRKIDLAKYEKMLSRKIQLHFKNELVNKHLKQNITQGVQLAGEILDGLERMSR